MYSALFKEILSRQSKKENQYVDRQTQPLEKTYKIKNAYFLGKNTIEQKYNFDENDNPRSCNTFYRYEILVEFEKKISYEEQKHLINIITEIDGMRAEIKNDGKILICIDTLNSKYTMDMIRTSYPIDEVLQELHKAQEFFKLRKILIGFLDNLSSAQNTNIDIRRITSMNTREIFSGIYSKLSDAAKKTYSEINSQSTTNTRIELIEITSAFEETLGKYLTIASEEELQDLRERK